MIDRMVTPLARRALRADFEAVRLGVGGLQSSVHRSLPISNIHDAEFCVFSQGGEDGIIQLLTSRIAVPNRVFIELGVDDYRESNTRFLLQYGGWSGLVVDGGTRHIDFLKTPHLFWMHPVIARSAFLTAENVNTVIDESGITGDIGLLSIDVDGNDFWIMKAIETVSPRILVMEYNSVFGSRQTVTVPYDPEFAYVRAHPSQLYFGASIAALCHLAADRGYRFVGTNRGG